MNNYEVVNIIRDYYPNISDGPIVMVEYTDMACAYYDKDKVFIEGKRTLQELKDSLSLMERVAIPLIRL